MGMISNRVLPTLLVLAATAAVQPSGVVDEASFTFMRDGAPYGTESFKIVRRLGAEGVEYVAHCTRTIDGRIVKSGDKNLALELLRKLLNKSKKSR